VNAFCEDKSFHHYADHAMGHAFHEGLARLLSWGSERRCAIMCAEALWWPFHPRIITDDLVAGGETVASCGMLLKTHLLKSRQKAQQLT
jgi:Protein of unknown function, DUF488